MRAALLVVSFVFISLTVQPSQCDFNVYNNKIGRLPPAVTVNLKQGFGEVQEACNDTECKCMLLAINMTLRSDGKVIKQLGFHQLNLTKRFELLLKNEKCSHFIGSDPKLFAGIRFCVREQTGVKRFEGSFFDKDNARYDFMMSPKVKFAKNAYSITRVSVSGIKKLVGLGRRIDGQLVRQDDFDYLMERGAHPTPQLGGKLKRPILGQFKKPTIELQVMVDSNFSRYFDHDKEAIIKFICMNVISADAMYSQMDIDVKLIGLRFWDAYGFKASSPNFTQYVEEVEKNFFEKAISYDAGGGPHMIRGLPDALLTYTHLWPFDGMLGLAGPYDPTVGANGLIKPVFDSFLTTGKDHPLKLHHFTSSATTAHEMGHMLSLPHPPLDDECFKDQGHCIMAANVRWLLPFWTKAERDSIVKNLSTTFVFLTEQNVRFSPIGSVHKTKHWMFPETRKYYYIVIGLAACFFTAVGMEYWDWRKGLSANPVPHTSPAVRYQRLEDERKYV